MRPFLGTNRTTRGDGTMFRACGSVARGGQVRKLPLPAISAIGNLRGAASRVDEPSERL
jgi:hypothetical protein